MEIQKKTINRIIFGALGCILFYWLLHEPERFFTVFDYVKDIFMPFVVGAVMAFILNVPMRAIERLLMPVENKGLRRALAILLTFLAIVVVLALVVMLLIPQIQATIESLVASLPGFFERIRVWITDFLNANPDIMEWVYENTDFESMNWSGLIEKIASFAGNSLSTIFERTVAAVGSLATGVFNGVISFVFALYCLACKENLATQGRKLLYAILPERAADETIRVLRLSNSTFSGFIAGQCLEAVILGCMFAVTMAIFRMPYMPLISVIISVTALVPIVGAFTGCVLGAFFIMVDNPMQAVFFVIMFLVLQQIEGNMIYPKVVGSSVGLPGMWVLLAVAIGGGTLGIIGMLLMIPLISVLYSLIREFAVNRVTERKIDPAKLKAQPPELNSKMKEKRKKKQECVSQMNQAETSKQEDKQ